MRTKGTGTEIQLGRCLMDGLNGLDGGESQAEHKLAAWHSSLNARGTGSLASCQSDSVTAAVRHSKVQELT